MDPFEAALVEAGGAAAAATATAQLRRLLADALRRGRAELAQSRSGYDEPVLVAVAAVAGDRLVAALPVAAALRADPDAVAGKPWTLAAALVAALAAASDAPAPARPQDLVLEAGELDGDLVLALLGASDAELAALAFDEQIQTADRLRAHALVVPSSLLDACPTRPPLGPGHPLRVAEAVARLGGDPADPGSADLLEDRLAPLLGTDASGHTRPHEDPDPAGRVARRILQRLNGMGKWGGYHTDFSHLPRGFAGNDRALAVDVGEALLAAGLLAEKPSVGQRHVYLDPRRAKEIHRLIETGERPPRLRLPSGR